MERHRFAKINELTRKKTSCLFKIILKKKVKTYVNEKDGGNLLGDGWKRMSIGDQ
jgi:hypothetical protein